MPVAQHADKRKMKAGKRKTRIAEISENPHDKKNNNPSTATAKSEPEDISTTIEKLQNRLIQKIGKIKEFPDFSNFELHPILENQQNQDKDILFFIEQLKTDLLFIKDILETVPEDTLSYEDKVTITTELFKKLPGMDMKFSMKLHSSIMQGMKSITSFLGFNNNDKEKSRTLHLACLRLEDVIKKDLSGSFQTFLNIKTDEKKLSQQLKTTRETIIAQIDVQITILQNYSNKISNYRGAQLDLIHKLLVSIYELNSFQENFIAEYSLPDQPDHNASFDAKKQIALLEAYNQTVRNKLEKISHTINKIPEIQTSPYKTYYEEEQKILLADFFNRVFKNNESAIIKSSQAQNIDILKQLKNKPYLEKIKIIQPFCRSLDQQLLDVFCKQLQLHDESLESIRISTPKYLIKFKKLWEIQNKIKNLQDVMGKENAKRNHVITQHFSTYKTSLIPPLYATNNILKKFEVDPENKAADLCIAVLDFLLKFYQIRNNILLLKKLDPKIHLSEESIHYLENFETNVLDKNESTKAINQLKEEYVNAFGAYMKRAQVKVRIVNTKINHNEGMTRVFHNNNPHQEALKESRSRMNGMMDDLQQHSKDLLNNAKSINLPIWHTRFESIQKRIDEEHKQFLVPSFDRCKEFEARYNSASYQKSCEIIKNINDEINQICDNHIEPENSTHYNEQINHLLDRARNNDYHRYIDPRLPSLLRLREAIHKKISKYLYDDFSKTSRDYLPEKLLNIARAELEPDHLMHYSDPVRSAFVQFIRRWIIYPIQQLGHNIRPNQAVNRLGFFGAAMGAGTTERLISDLMLDIATVDAENDIFENTGGLIATPA